MFCIIKKKKNEEEGKKKRKKKIYIYDIPNTIPGKEEEERSGEHVLHMPPRGRKQVCIRLLRSEVSQEVFEVLVQGVILFHLPGLQVYN